MPNDIFLNFQKFKDEEYVICQRCGQCSSDLVKCSFCHVRLTKVKQVYNGENSFNGKTHRNDSSSKSKTAESSVQSKNNCLHSNISPGQSSETFELEENITNSNSFGGDTSDARPSSKTAHLKRRLFQPTCASKQDSKGKRGSHVFKCKSVHIGSYVVTKITTVKVTGGSLEFELPTVTERLTKDSIKLKRQDLRKVFGHFQEGLNFIYLHPKPSCGYIIRKTLKMREMAVGRKPEFFDPSSEDEYYRKIVLFPEEIPSLPLQRHLKKYFPGPCLFQEVEKDLANEILDAAGPLTPVRTPVQSPEKSSSSVSDESPSMPRSQARSVRYRNPVNRRYARSSVSPKHITVYDIEENVKTKSSLPLQHLDGDTESSRSPEAVCYYLAKGLKYPISTDDLATLNEGECLNDRIINFYLAYLVTEKVSESLRNRIHLFDTFLYLFLTSASPEEEKIRSWTQNVDIFSKDYVIIPINVPGHWIVAVLCFPGLAVGNLQNPSCSVRTSMSPQSNSDHLKNDETCQNTTQGPADDSNSAESSIAEGNPRPCILIFDSLGIPRDRVFRNLRDYLTEEWRYRKGTNVDFKDIECYMPNAPKQPNHYDCGIYVLQYMECFLEDLSTTGAERWSLRQDWFPVERVRSKRREIKQLILNLSRKDASENTSPPKLRRKR